MVMKLTRPRTGIFLAILLNLTNIIILKTLACAPLMVQVYATMLPQTAGSRMLLTVNSWMILSWATLKKPICLLICNSS